MMNAAGFSGERAGSFDGSAGDCGGGAAGGGEAAGSFAGGRPEAAGRWPHEAGGRELFWLAGGFVLWSAGVGLSFWAAAFWEGQAMWAGYAAGFLMYGTVAALALAVGDDEGW